MIKCKGFPTWGGGNEGGCCNREGEKTGGVMDQVYATRVSCIYITK
ncbi:MAG: hypothetical protein ACM3P0_12360 [Acidobacteriota bacterium]